MNAAPNIWQTLPHGFTCLAPMEGVTDWCFRQVIARAGRPDLFFTEFTNVSSFASEKGRRDALERLKVAPSDAPIIAQIWGKNPEHFGELARALEELGFAGIDLNFGCPDRHVNAAGGGAAMIRTPELAVKCFREVCAATNLPVSVKTRLGYTNISEFRNWLPVVLTEHPAALTVHLRTRKEMSKVPAHYELIPEVVKLKSSISPETKLIINGDIKNFSSTGTISDPETMAKIDGFMIGRGVLENPFCFTNHQGTTSELLELLNLHLDLFDKFSRTHEASFGRPASFEPLKHYFKIYINSFAGASDLRAELMNCHSTDEVRSVLAHKCLC